MNRTKLKIGILSINVHTADLNFACPLHSLVFSNALTELGYENVVVNYYPVYAKQHVDQQYPLLELIKDKDNPKKQKQIKYWTEMFYPRKERYARFDAFIKKHYKFTEKVYDAALLDTMSSAEGINCFIAATDTIWRNYAKGFDKGFFMACRAMRNAYKIAYSVSRGPSTYDEPAQRQFIEYIKNIHDISVREQSLKDYITSISDIQAQVVLDPVFLAKREFYDSLAVTPAQQNGYVLLYLMQEADEFLALAAKFAEARGLELIELSKFYNHKAKTGYAKHSVIYDIGIEEWLGYIKHADYVFTNSFHGSCFSIMFEKQFFYNGKRGGDKVKLLFKTFGLEWRSEEQAFDQDAKLLVDDIDYAPVNAIREQRVEQSLDFLKNALRKAETFVEERACIICDYLSTGDEYFCCGCTACETKCPHGAIKMTQSSEGFHFPEINKNQCVHCGLCNKACPHNGKKSLYSEPLNVYLAHHNKDHDRVNSSSGGIFAAMADVILKQGGAVVGVRFNENYEALYDIATTAEDCLAFRYSKYVEAAGNDIYIKTKAALEGGRKVLFTGTPCKISGLLNYLGRDYENLYCADLLCHGTNSPMILKRYLQEKEAENNSKLKHFQFRSPRAPQGPVTVEYVYENGKTEILNKSNDLYMGAFIKNVMLKRSCYECEYCGNNGISDITFGDFWGGKKFYAKKDADKGISCVKVNTKKGAALFEQMNVYAQEQSVTEMYEKNHKRPSKLPPQRNQIFDWINHEGLTVAEALERATKEKAPAKTQKSNNTDARKTSREKDIKALQTQLDNIYKSNSWKITKPLRAVMKIFKK